MAQTRAITEGFDLYPGDINIGGVGLRSTWISPNAEWMGMGVGRYGGQSLNFFSGNDHRQMYRPFPASSQVVVGFAYFRGSTLDTVFMHLRNNGNTDQITLRVDGAGYLYMYRGAALLKQSTVPLIVVNSWNYIELAVTVSETAGNTRLYMNDVIVDDFTFDNIDTQNVAGDSTIAQIMFEGRQSAQWDDVYVEIGGTTRVGEGRIVALPVTSDVQAQFTPSTGASNFAVVDEVPVNATDYNMSAVLGATDIFTVSDMNFTPAQIHGVQVSMIAQKDEAGLRIVNSKLVSNGIEADGTNLVLALNTFNWKRDFYAKNPDGGVNWLKAAVDALQVGYEVNT